MAGIEGMLRKRQISQQYMRWQKFVPKESPPFGKKVKYFERGGGLEVNTDCQMLLCLSYVWGSGKIRNSILDWYETDLKME